MLTTSVISCASDKKIFFVDFKVAVRQAGRSGITSFVESSNLGLDKNPIPFFYIGS